MKKPDRDENFISPNRFFLYWKVRDYLAVLHDIRAAILGAGVNEI